MKSFRVSGHVAQNPFVISDILNPASGAPSV